MAICLIAFLGGCGSSDPSKSETSSGGGGSFSSVSGFVADGYISGAKIQAYQINANGTKGAAIGSSTTSDATGAYSLNLGNYSGPVLIESSGGSYTDWVTGAVVNLAAADVMRAVVSNLAVATPVTAHITPLTYMAAQRALQDMAVNGTPAATAIANANNQISKYYGSFNILTDKPINPTMAGSATGVSQTQVDYGMVLAGISQTASDKTWKPFSLVTALAADATDGTFDGKQGTTQLTVAKNAGGTDNLPATAAKTDMANEIDTFQKSGQNKSGGTTTPAIISDLKSTSGTVSSKPDPPTNVQATAQSSTQINLTWSAVAGAEGYKIYRGGLLQKAVAKAFTTISDSGLTPNTQYCYYVTATDTVGNESNKSSQVCVTTSGTPPPVPTALTVTPFSDTQIDLSWVSGGGSTTGFKVYRGGALLKSTSTASASDTGLTAGTQYCYAVSAYDIAGNESDQTTQVCATTDPPPTPASIDLLLSNSQMPSDNSQKVTLTALVKDSKNRAMTGQSVSFSSESTLDPGIITVTQATTDASGQAVANLGTGGNKSYRTITVKAKAGLKEASNTVEVTGTALYISGQDSVVLANTAEYTVSLKDSAGSPITGKSVTITCKFNKFIATGTNTVTGTTDGNGQIKVTLNATDAAGQKDTLTAESASMGLTSSRVATKEVTVVNTYFVFNAPTADKEINVNTAQTVEVEYKEGGVPKVGVTVDFSASRGALSAGTAITNALGKATVTITSTTVGPATLSAAVAGGPSATQRVEFISATPVTMTLQADPSVIGTNASGGTKEQSKIVAVLRDINDNFVKNKTVNFTLTADPSVGYLSPASAKTDSAGMATVQYVAGAAQSGTEGVKIKASVPGTTVPDKEVLVTVAKKSLFVKLGEPSGISSKDAATYQKEYTVMVTDAAGNPIQGAVVTASIFPVAYYKGTFTDSGAAWVWNRTLGEIYNPDSYPYTDPTGAVVNYCINEDLSTYTTQPAYVLNGILDKHTDNDREDHNKSGALEPGGIASVTASVVTDANGLGKLTVLYLKKCAPWATVKLRATTYVQGTEGKDETVFLLKYLVDDYPYGGGIAPPPSPYGSSAVCSDAK